MLILPLPARPDWSRPPWATLSIMALCLAVFLIQGGDYQRAEEAWRFYQHAGIGKIEIPAYLADLERSGQTEKLAAVRRSVARGNGAAALRMMEADNSFIERLRHDRVITRAHPDYPGWRAKRSQYEELRERIVTEHYSLSSRDPRPVTLLTHMFLHDGIMHLAGNMAVLFVVGYTVEAALGPLGFLALYLLGGVGAAVPDVLMPADELQLSLGASGAVSAVMAAYLVLFGYRRITFFYWLGFVFGTVRWPALAILPLWLANELLQNFVFDPEGRVNYMAHFAGLTSGALLAGLYRWRRKGRSADIVHRQDDEQAVAALLAQAAGQVAEMKFGPAALTYRKLLAEHPGVDAQCAIEYRRIATLARQPELLADANHRLLLAAAQRGAAIPSALLGEIVLELPDALPKLAAAQWEGLLARLIDGGELDGAERLLLRLFPVRDLRQATLRQAGRLANSFIARGEDGRAAPILRLRSALAAQVAVR
ncbi:rhomboid family intramembrane serine protease [Pseudothauera nasutitermitis]|uniref:Rhomboid family intramembrane serine protease n=1 Tax=Pseudothauera nasutitermitis TaxID=2565930 RepID=A0A4S4B132_9RHOO|nr:rhomboid family intramembrane serine protease [Pseudothauera nasutitermitis]THF66256.1 rhomboid family intramembrane serine protease [Pseudothauera nasutitermitis]